MSLGSESLAILASIGMVVGVLSCFWGHRIFRLLFGLIGFALGGLLTGGIALFMTGEMMTAALAGAVGGVVGAAVLLGLYTVAVFVLGACTAIAVGALLSAFYGQFDIAAWTLLAVIGGLVAILAQKFAVVVATASLGAWNIVVAGVYVVTRDATIYRVLQDPTSTQNLGFGIFYGTVTCWAGLSIIGIMVQYNALSRLKKAG